MNDYISKQSAIDALEKEKPTPFVNKDRSIDPFGAGQQNQWYRDGIAIMNMPSADVQPVRNWIPVSKDLPKTPIRVQVQLDNNWIITAYYDEGEWYDVPGDGEPIDGVLAWMPLPEPYKDGDRNDIR